MNSSVDAATDAADAAGDASDAAGDAGDGAIDAGEASLDAGEAAVDASDGSIDAGDADGSTLGECTPGAVDCYGAEPRLCTAEGRWTPGPRCPEFCYQGQCVPCIPGMTACPVSGLERCSSDYKWVPCTGAGCGCTDVPQDCWVAGGECGLVNDWLGGLANCDLEIGGCPSSFVCGTGADANTCVAATAGAAKECTPGDYDCGGAVQRRCSRTGKWLPLLPGEPCGTPYACVQEGYNCGTANLRSAGTVDCGACPSGYACGVLSPNRCAPVP